MAEFNDDIYFASIMDLNQKLKARAFSSEDLTRAFSRRLIQLGPRYNALATSLEETALKQARDADDDLKRDRFKGPLQGVPFGAKDLLSVAYKPTTWGARPYADQRFDFDATVIEKLDRASATLVAKLAMVELAGAGGYQSAAASLTGPGLNPWDITRWAGGSSSGSAAAVAAGLVPFAIGSETWGSILTPCAYCGVTGLRPTYGLVSRYGAMAVSWSLDKIGPIGRSAGDCGRVLHAISGGDSSDPTSAGKSFYYTPQFARKLTDLRVGFAPSDIAEHAEPATRPAFQDAIEVLRATGVRMTEVELPDLPYVEVISTIIAAESSAAFEPLIESGKVDQLADQKQIAGLRAGLEIPAKDYLRAMRIRSIVRDELKSQFGVATKITEPLDQPLPPSQPPKRRGLASLGAAGNLAGLPALSIPCGFADGLPVGLQIVGRAFTENNLLALGEEFQNRTDWHRRRPKV
jgi:aspartyl-tRNA(Asn)/glutamyl-tRNA(Gln) amidotransferase subunit A